MGIIVCTSKDCCVCYMHSLQVKLANSMSYMCYHFIIIIIIKDSFPLYGYTIIYLSKSPSVEHLGFFPSFPIINNATIINPLCETLLPFLPMEIIHLIMQLIPKLLMCIAKYSYRFLSADMKTLFSLLFHKSWVLLF